MNLASIIEGHPAEHAALIHRGRTISFGELRDLVGRTRQGLIDAGVRPGERVVTTLRNTPDFAVVYLATLGTGAIAVPLNPTSPPFERDSEMAAVEPVLVVGEDAASYVADQAAPLVERQPDDIAALLFTSGTAGSPKAAMLSHGCLSENLAQVTEAPIGLVHPDDVIYGVVPHYHSLGLSSTLGVALSSGVPIVLVDHFDAAAVPGEVAEAGVTTLVGPPAFWAALTRVEGIDRAAFASVRLAVSGGAALTQEIADAVEDRLGLAVRQGYGLTETSPTLTMATGPETPVLSVGRPLPRVELRLVGADGEDVPVGDSGEIWARGPNVFLGYWNEPDATAAALTADGWLRTGDMGVVDDDGNLYIVNRIKDLIVVSGFNVFPGQVEAVLADHPTVAAAAVVGEPDDVRGEVPVAYVIPAKGATIDADALIEHTRERLARYKCPVAVEVVSDLPAGRMGKLKRSALRRSQTL